MNGKFFIDMAPLMPTFYNELGLASGAGDTQADGSPSSTSHGGDQATLDFSDSGFDTSLAYGMGNPYAPFDGPCFSYDMLLTQPSWNTDDPFDLGNYGLPSFSSTPSPGTGEVASGSALPQATQHTERAFALDISNGQGRVGHQVPQPSSGSSSDISAIKVGIPMNFPHNEGTINTSTASSSPARKSARQRGNIASSTSHKTKRATWAKSAKSSHPAKSSNSSGTESVTQTATQAATQTAQRVKHNCVHPGCRSTFYDRPTMHRHVLTIHLKIRPPCPGCHNTFSRDDSLKRHLETRPIDSHCRAAAREDGWEETEHDGKVKMTARQQRDRVQIIVDAYGTS